MSTSVESQADHVSPGGAAHAERSSHTASTRADRPTKAGAASLPDVAKVFSKLVPRQLQDELALAKLELKDKGVKVGKGIAFVVVGLVFLLLATIALVVAAVAGLAQVMPFWLSALIVAAFFLLVLIVLAAVGGLMIKSAMPLTPVRAVRGLKYDLGVVKEGSAYTEARVRREEAEAKERKAQEKKEKKEKKSQASNQPPAPTESQLRQRLSVRRDKIKELRDDAEGRKNTVQNSAVGFVDRTKNTFSNTNVKASAAAGEMGERVGPIAVAVAAGTAFVIFLIKLVRR